MPAILLGLVLAACRRELPVDEDTSKAVAQAGSEVLRAEALRDELIEPGENAADSAYSARKTIEHWATESLMYQEAIEKLAGEEVSIERSVQDYRKALVNHLYETRLVEENLDTNISRAEIEEYYEAHRDNFILKENIVKVRYYKVPLTAPGVDKIRKLSKGDGKGDDLLQLVKQNAENFYLSDSTWLFLDDVKKEVPQLQDATVQSISPGKVFEFTDDVYYYYLRFVDLKVKNSLSPLNFERKNIRKFIVNARKAQLINEYKRQLLEKAVADKRFRIF